MLYVPIYEVLSDSSDRIWLLAKKEVNDIEGYFSVNIFKIKQSMFLTFLRLLKIVQAIGSTKRGTTEFIHKLIRADYGF